MKYHYVAFNRDGRRIKGLVDAETPETARQMLREKQLQPLSLKVTGKRSISRRIAPRDLVLLIRQLSTLIGASLPLAESLDALAQQNEKPAVRSMVERLYQRVLKGDSLAEAVAEFPGTFSPLYRAMISAGEASGRLDRVLEQLADYCEQSHQLKSKMIQSMLYPILLLSVALIVAGILLTAVVPEVIVQFNHMQQSLPATTRLLMTISDGTKQYGLLLLLFILLCIVCFQLLLRRPAIRFKWHQHLVRLPLVGTVVLNLNLARYARTLSILIHGSVPLLESMAISAAVLNNEYVRSRLQRAADRVREGSTLTQALQETALLSPMMCHMIASGESSGQLDGMLKRSADIQEQMFISKMTTWVMLLEPLLIIVMAAFVLFIILAILQPILQLNSLTG
ncbi:type II secretion system inner membrane protein GspF [Pantoea endophytica]